MNPPLPIDHTNSVSFEILNNAYIKQADEPPPSFKYISLAYQYIESV